LNAAVGKNRNIQYQGVTIEFSKISSSLFFGFVNQDGFFMASAEKAVLDTLYYRGTMPAYDELDMDHLDLPKLEKMSIPYPKSIRKLLQTIPNLSLSLPNSTPLGRG
jgi:hypothetical protein